MDLHPRITLAQCMNAIGASFLLTSLCTIFFLSQGISLAAAVLLALPAACALGLCFRRAFARARARRNGVRAEAARIDAVLSTLSLTSPERLIQALKRPIKEEYQAMHVHTRGSFMFFARENRRFASVALTVPPRSAMDIPCLIRAHEHAARVRAERLVVLSNAEPGALSALLKQFCGPEVIWMDPRELASLPGEWLQALPPATQIPKKRFSIPPERRRALFGYGFFLLVVYIIFKQILYLIFGLLCLFISLLLHIRKKNADDLASHPFA